MLKANNLSDVVSVPNSRTNLGLGSLAVLSTVNDGNWSGTDLAVTNGGTGASTAANARTNLGAQTLDAFLTSIAALGTAADKILYTTGVDTAAETTLTSFMRTLLDDTTAILARSTLGKILPRYGLLCSLTGVDLNTTNTDNPMTVEATRYRIDKVTVDNASINTTAATAGVFSAPAGGGTAIAADQVLSALTATTKFKDLTLGGSIATDVLTSGTIYFRTGTAQSAADTANVFVFGWRLD